MVTRDFNAPRELVFAAWTEPEHFARWFGPHGAEVDIHAMEARPGGALRFDHSFPDGMTVRVKGVFGEVVPNARLSFTVGFVDAADRPDRHPAFPDWPLEALLITTVTFETLAAGTRLTIHQVLTPESAAATETVKTERRMAREGWSEGLDRLAELLERKR